MHGNCSSATVLIVLEEMVTEAKVEAGDYVVALAFGPGLTLCATLLQMA
jgi:alkylresorcinol/alkylpyrone synthase